MLNSTTRFSNRVEDYAKYRPNYPLEVIDLLKSKFNLSSSHTIVDVGSGTGISSELFLKNGNTVFGVEPNDKMRLEAEKNLAHYGAFKSVNGVSNNANISNKCADFIVVAQAFHWFEPVSTKAEFKRILKDNGLVVILFNDRATKGSPFAEQYEALLNEFGSDYKEVKHKNVGEKRHKEFLGEYQEFHFSNHQDFNFEALLGRLKSSSYAPKEGDIRFDEMVKVLRRIFDDNCKNGLIRMEYDTQLFCSRFKHE